MKLSEFSDFELQARLFGVGLCFVIGPFSISVSSRIPVVKEGIVTLYGDYEVCAEDAFIDFHVNIDTPTNLRQWFKPQVGFSFDGFKPFMPLPRAQAFALFEWSLNWCVANHMHNYLIIHAGVVGKNGLGVVLPAPPGSGKSTLSAGLAFSGWQLLSDELALFDLNEAQITSFPRPINLKNESIDIMRKFAPEGIIGPIVSDTNKGTVAHLKTPVENIKVHTQKNVLPEFIVFPKYKKNAELMITNIPKGRGFMRLVDNAFNYQLLGEAGFSKMLDITNGSEFFELEYSNLDDAIHWFDGLTS